MKKTTILLGCLLAVLLTAALAEEPMWVDGYGNIISGPGGSVVDTITPDQSKDNDTAYDGDGIEDGSEGSGAHRTPDPDAPQKWEYTPSTLTAVYDGQSYEVLALGTRLTRLKQGRTSFYVRTSDLTLSTAAPAGKQLAIINTPKSGRATMFKGASSKSAIIYKCQTGRVVAVNKTSKRFAGVHYADADGYVSTNSVTYTEPWTGDIEVARIAYKGNVKSGETVKVRQKPSGASRILDEFKCGTLVTVLGRNGSWTEIEVENLRCFILTKFLTEAEPWTPELTAVQQPEPEAAAKPAKRPASPTDLHPAATETDLPVAPEWDDGDELPVMPDWGDDEPLPVIPEEGSNGDFEDLPVVFEEPIAASPTDSLQIEW